MSEAHLLRAARTLSYLVAPARALHSFDPSKERTTATMSAENSVGTKELDTDPATNAVVPRVSAHALAESDNPPPQSRIAVLIPCYNEEATVGLVVKQFQAQLPAAAIYVFDNNSSDQTAACAQAAGAHVFFERRQGKGYVTQTMFRQVDADVYVIVDGDATYPAAAVHQLIAPVLAGTADMVVGTRLHPGLPSEFRQMNRWGNRLVLIVLNSIFKVKLTDILSGYRAFNRKFVKALPLFGGGFEIETELTIKAIARGFNIIEIPTVLTARPEGSHSKIRFFRDGAIILNTILALFRDYKPLTFFGLFGLLLLMLALIPGLIAVFDSTKEMVVRLSLAALTGALGLCGLLSVTVGLILHSIARRSQELEYQVEMLGHELRRELPAIAAARAEAEQE
jgi:glycosyltransferase involved in cell wall biosynthesis